MTPQTQENHSGTGKAIIGSIDFEGGTSLCQVMT